MTVLLKYHSIKINLLDLIRLCEFRHSNIIKSDTNLKVIKRLGDGKVKFRKQ